MHNSEGFFMCVLQSIHSIATLKTNMRCSAETQIQNLYITLLSSLMIKSVPKSQTQKSWPYLCYECDTCSTGVYNWLIRKEGSFQHGLDLSKPIHSNSLILKAHGCLWSICPAPVENIKMFQLSPWGISYYVSNGDLSQILPSPLQLVKPLGWCTWQW